MGLFRIVSRLACAGLLAATVGALPASAQSQDAADLAKACAAEAHLPVPGDMIGKRWSEMDPTAAMAACRAAFDAAPEDYRVAADFGRALLRAGEYRLAQELLRIVADKSPQAQFSLAMSNLSIGNMATHEQVEGALTSTRTPDEPAPAADYSDTSTDVYVDTYEADTYDDSGTDYGAEPSGQDSSSAEWTGDYASEEVASDEYAYVDSAAEDASYEDTSAYADSAEDSYADDYADAGGSAESVYIDDYAAADDHADYPELDSGPPEGVRNFDTFLSLVTQTAKDGYVPAQIALGKYRIGALGSIDRTDLDLVGAAALFRQAASEGSNEAKHWLAYSYRHGMGAVKDPSEAARLYREAAEAGFAPAMAALGNLYHDGFGVPLDAAEGDRWLRRAADAGEGYGQYLLAQSLEAQNADEATVTALLETAAEGGNAAAQAALADRIALSDPPRAATLYRRAADQGHFLSAMLHASPENSMQFSLAITRAMQDLLTYSRVLPSLPIDPHLVFYGYRSDKLETDGYMDRLNGAVGQLQLSLAKKLLAKRTLLGRETGMTLQDAKAALLTSAEEGDVEAAVALAYPSEELSEEILSQDEREHWRQWLAALPPEQRQDLAQAIIDSRGKGQNFSLVLGGLDQPAALGDAQQEKARLETLGKFHLYSLAVERAVGLVSTPEFAALPPAERMDLVSTIASGLQSTCAWRASVSAFVQQARMLKEATECNEQSAIFRATPTQLETLFNAGMPRAGVQLAYLHRAGELGAVDNAEAAKWLQDSIGRCESLEAERASAEAGVDEFGDSDVEWFARRCADDTKVAKLMLAVLYERGEGVPQDLEKAFALYREGALGSRGEPGSRTDCLDCALFGNSEVDPVAAAGAVRIYASGAAGWLSEDEVVRLLSTASRYEEPTAQRMLGVLYLQGKSVIRDEAEGARWLLKAALGGDAEAQFDLAMLYENGVGVARDPARAKHWYEAAAAGGVTEASPEFTAARKLVADKRKNSTVADLDGQMAAIEQVADQFVDVGDFDTRLKMDLDDIAQYHRLTGNPDAMISTRLKALAVNDAMLVEKHGTMENYFALLGSSCQWGRASLEAYRAERPEAALYFAKVSVNKLQEARGFVDQLDRNLRECFLEVHQDRYRWLADLLMEMGRYPEAEQVLAMLKDFEFQEFTRSGDGGKSGDGLALSAPEKATYASYTGLSNELLKANQVAAQLSSKPRSARTEEEIEQNRIAQRVINDARTAFRDHFDALQTEVRALRVAAATGEGESGWEANAGESISGILSDRGFADGTAALHAVVTPGRIHWLLSTPQLQRAIPIEVSQETLQREIGQYRAALVGRDPAIDAKATKLYRMIFEPVDAELKQLGITTVLVSLDGSLRYVPLAALNDGHDWLARRYAFSSFRGTEHLSASEGDPDEWHIAGFGVTREARTKSGNHFPPLPAVAGELAAIVGGNNAVAAGTVLLDEQFDRTALENAILDQIPVLHIATHFKLAPDAQDSVLLLGNGDELPLTTFRRDGDFTFKNVSLLALSACQTAVSTEANAGSEFDSMGQVAQKAGAKSVLASLWSVNDGSTARLMHAFYENKIAKGLSKIEALRQAQLAFLDGQIERDPAAEGDRAPTAEREGGPAAAATDWDHPYYWAAFLLMGNVS